MSDREVTIVIKGKNVSQAEFDAARKQLLGVEDQVKKTSQATGMLGSAFKALGAAITVGAITAAIKSYADFTGQISDLSAKTGIGTEALQKLKFAAEQNGGSLEQVTGAIMKLGANLAGGNESAVGALKALGLSFDTIRGMEPDKAFTTLADAIAKVPDPMAQSKLAMDLFGKSGAELLPMMKGNLSETAAEAQRLGIIMSEDAVAAGDEFGDSMSTLALVGKSLIAQVLEPIVPVLTTVAKWLGERLPVAVKFVTDTLSIGFARAWIDARILFHEFILGIAEGVNKIPLLGEKIGFSAQTIAGLRSNVDTAKASLEIFTQQTITAGASHDKAARSVATLNLDYAENERAAKRAAAANNELDPTIKRLTDSFVKQIEAHTRARTSLSLPAVHEGFRLQRVELEKLEPVQTRTLEATADAQEAARKWALENGATLAPSIRRVSTELADASAATVSFASSMREGLLGVLASVPQTLIQAFQGGGNWMGAIKSIGSKIGATLGGNIGAFFGGPLGQMIGNALGSLVGPLIGKIGSLFTSKNTAEVRRYNEEISKVRDTLLAQYGTLDQLEAKANAVGLSFRENWGHQGREGLKSFNILAEEFRRLWDGLENDLRDSRAELDQLLDRGSRLGYEFDQSGNLVRVNFEKMREAAQRYGVDLGSLGPAFQNQRIHTSALEIINDFELLTRGGASVGGVLSGMKDEISALVRDSIKFGTEIPSNMQPWIKELLRTGQLTDENGNALTDLTGIKFGGPVATEFEKISTKINELIEAIRVMVDKINTTITPAIDHATRDRTIRIGFEVDEPPNLDLGAGYPSVGYARGTFGVHGVDFPDFGSGTSVLLHNREAVTPFEERIPTAFRWLSDAGMAAPAGDVKVYVLVDKDGNASQVSYEQFILETVQRGLSTGQLEVPSRFITGGRR